MKPVKITQAAFSHIYFADLDIYTNPPKESSKGYSAQIETDRIRLFDNENHRIKDLILEENIQNYKSVLMEILNNAWAEDVQITQEGETTLWNFQEITRLHLLSFSYILNWIIHTGDIFFGLPRWWYPSIVFHSSSEKNSELEHGQANEYFKNIRQVSSKIISSYKDIYFWDISTCLPSSEETNNTHNIMRYGIGSEDSILDGWFGTWYDDDVRFVWPDYYQLMSLLYKTSGHDYLLQEHLNNQDMYPAWNTSYDDGFVTNEFTIVWMNHKNKSIQDIVLQKTLNNQANIVNNIIKCNDEKVYEEYRLQDQIKSRKTHRKKQKEVRRQLKENTMRHIDYSWLPR